jgi:hypothetical protein
VDYQVVRIREEVFCCHCVVLREVSGGDGVGCCVRDYTPDRRDKRMERCRTREVGAILLT